MAQHFHGSLKRALCRRLPPLCRLELHPHHRAAVEHDHEVGDAWELACAFLFAVEILVLFHYSSRVDAVRLSRMQFLVVAILSTVLMFLLEEPTAEAVRLALPAILYAGIFSSGIAYTLQILGQANVNPTVASLVMSLESVFSALSGWLILGERLSPRELLGSALMFAAIVLAQVEFRPKRS